jgi:lysophospholipase L1-like esterase
MLGPIVFNAPTHSGRRSARPITVVGFGACIISGFPLPEEAGFLRLAAARAAAEADADIKLSIVTITSCTAPKADAVLAEKVLPLHPDIVVFQFGTSDVSIAVRRLWYQVASRPRVSKPRVPPSDKPLRLRNQVDSFLSGCAGLALGAQPASSRSDYRQSIAKMVELTVSSGAYPIVSTPFVRDNFVSDAWARCYSYDLVKDFAGRKDVSIIDTWEPLARYPRRKMLLHDGLHLSRLAHEILGERLKPELVMCIKNHAARLQALLTA